MTDISTATPTTPTMPDPRPLFAAALATSRDVVAGVRGDHLELPTPCAGFDVRTLGRHVLAVLQRLVVVGRVGSFAGTADFLDDVADDDWVATFDRLAAEARVVWSDDAVLADVLTVPWADLPGAVVLLIYVNEITVHTWDLATATGQQPAWDPEVLAVAYAAIQRGLPREGRDNRYLPFDEVVDTPADAPLIDKLVAWNGRRP